MNPPEERLRAALAGRYQIERELGQGGMATVYLAHDLRHDREVALKVMRPELVETLGAERFLREIQLVARLSHPHILPLFDSGRAEECLYYVMPNADGRSLRDRLAAERQLPVEDAVRIATEVARDAGLADCYGILRVYGWISAEEGNPPGKKAAARGMALDPSLAETNFSSGFCLFYCDRKWRDALPHMQRALEINPRNALAQGYMACFSAMVGQADVVRRHLDRARELDPLAPFTHGLAAAAFHALGLSADAEQAARQSLELQPDFILGLWILGLALSEQDRHEEAIECLERALALSRAPIFVAVMGLGYARAGRVEDARRLLGELEERASRGEYVPAFSNLAIHVGLGDLPAARRELAAAVDELTPPFSIRVTTGVRLDALTDDPEIARLYKVLYQSDTPEYLRAVSSSSRATADAARSEA